MNKKYRRILKFTPATASLAILSLVAPLSIPAALAAATPAGTFDWPCDMAIGPKTPAPTVVATDDVAPTSVIFYLDGVKLGEVTHPTSSSDDGKTKSFQAAPWNSANLTGTMHALKAEVTDQSGNKAWVKTACNTEQLAFVVDLILPQLKVTSPVDGDITQATSVKVTGEASDVQSGLDYVSVNGQKVKLAAGSNSFSADVNFPATQATLEIAVIASDKGGNQTSARLMVSHPATPAPSPSPTTTATPSPEPSPSATASPAVAKNLATPAPQAKVFNAALGWGLALVVLALVALGFMFREQLGQFITWMRDKLSRKKSTPPSGSDKDAQ